MYYRNHSSPLFSKSYDLGVEIVKMIKRCPNDWRLSSLYNQITKSGTSVGANINEAEFAQSPADFTSKMSIALKEADETQYWLELFLLSEIITQNEFESLNGDLSELIAILTTSIKTIKNKSSEK